MDRSNGMTSNCISHQEVAKVLHADGSSYKMGTLVYGTYEEIEEWCEKNNMWVDKYMDHVNPSTLYNTAEWVGTGLSDPFAVSVPFDYRKSRAMGTFNTRGVNLDKW
tara:strand:- start:56326 stop:56646 length:321 start_codon:yes stop_codon:yes gene_type:complete